MTSPLTPSASIETWATRAFGRFSLDNPIAAIDTASVPDTCESALVEAQQLHDALVEELGS